jgi:hypothetical protein
MDFEPDGQNGQIPAVLFLKSTEDRSLLGSVSFTSMPSSCRVAVATVALATLAVFSGNAHGQPAPPPLVEP